MRTGAPSRIVVVGASAAGLSVVEGLRREGYTGRLTLVGEEAHLPYDRPPLSKQLLSGEWEAERLQLRASGAVNALDLDLRLGTAAVSLDTGAGEVALADGSRVGYDALAVATGTRARRLRGTDGISGVHVLRTLEDALALREDLAAKPHLVVVGGGFVGAETAAVARGLGCEVTLVTDTAQPMGDALGDGLGTMLRAVHTEHGVRLMTGALVDHVLTAGGRATGVRLVDGRTIAADTVLVGIGAQPNVEWLADSGVPVSDGVVCDATLHAGSGVWAAGDVASWPHPLTGEPVRVEHRTNAAEQGLAVARNMLAGPERATPFETVPYVWTDQYDLKIQIYGRTRGADDVRIVEGGLAERRLVAVYGKNGRVCAAVGINMARALRSYRPQVAEATTIDARSAA
ncbi:NAD(P)/FAD-dependent oxidoreductase [Streptomyces sp. AK02-01A]|uniref:NAD(P)/FAD-dependent oxidoreductase n=1 Tax=Streptomyces sp. AK02-01A TaxID=3028648 RepID=UPI0029B9E04A|nr:FAD-dependent oxidoreductase [Streptomyces sp. AK02-01A]MDX3853400.1 FAD-dependent oxidoreductase [Streptomyces sp. AK02-01A]